MNRAIIFSATIIVALSICLIPLFNLPQQWLNLESRGLMADLIVKNGVIFTSDASLPFADSMAVLNGRILRVGNYSALKDLAGDKTRELDLEGKVVVPGFIDSHVHLIWGGLQMKRVELHGVDRKDEFVRRVKEAVRNSKEDTWLLGGGWNNDLWGGELPVAYWIDDITPYNPVWLIRMDGHMGLANSVALKLAGIHNLLEDPNGGTILRSAHGEPNGLLIDAAMKLILPWIPEVSVDERREAFLGATNLALRRGVTSVVDFGRYLPGASVEHSWEDLSDVYQWADSLGKMRIRLCLFFSIETRSRLFELITKTGRALSDWIYLGGVKAFADGSLGSSSALFYETYIGEPQNFGLQVTDIKSLFNMTLESDKVGLQVAIHAIGDKANDMILDMYESVVSTTGKRDRRFRVRLSMPNIWHLEQCFVLPDHLLDDADSATKKLGVDRAQKGSYKFRSLLASNTRLALGSDWPVTNINPLGSIRTAMKRIPPGWENAWVPSERLSLKDAIIAHTISAAYACFLDDDLGSLSSGKFADFVILSTNSWDDFEVEGYASVEATYVAGSQAYP
ncbi:protein LONG AFTER FAR-RED 3 isoform X2 [Jatropha curcas]|uniref:protein LONG AFTER FAR-RED 3 isoform X2 n=1 Tax=Jatropha curcas TaxID=180498 RepID=UPI0009D653D2|nr:protein LONG AFTER FAR-RED 3 isoform X2 [Jatropha curcas]